jgi:type I restriction-modification system DNA methylase subunit
MEELIQRGYITPKGLKGATFGCYQELNIGTTSLLKLVEAGVCAVIPKEVPFDFTRYSPPKRTTSAKPDRVYVIEREQKLIVVAVAEYKTPKKLKNDEQLTYTAEQGLFSAYALGAFVAIATNGNKEYYVNVTESVKENRIVFFEETRSLNPAVLDDLIAGNIVVRDPAVLSEKVWQIIWHATKDEPKECLLTFVELFLLKFLSDNLPSSVLANSLRFYELTIDDKAFVEKYGKTQIEYYIENIRPEIKRIFQDNTICDDSSIANIFGLSTIVSKTSIINGFSFLRSSIATPSTYNKAFCDVLKEFQQFGSLTSIDPEFKTRLYEAFLKKSLTKAKLGQFFTPRNVVKSIIKMAQISKLPDDAVCLDPAAGVGGFILEPFIVDSSLKNNITFSKGSPNQKIRFIGVDVDVRTHILAKANTLIHFAEEVRSPTVTTAALNKLMARMFVLMNSNETLGSLEYPAKESVDLIMTNPPYVTRGSGIYKDTISAINGTRNGEVLSEYYDGVGLGLEGYFLRYISGALKPGGRAFVIVPQGFLTRTETGTKEILYNECNLIASISLPRNTFFNTPQKTYIIVLEKRFTESDGRPHVFCAIAQSVGESLDAKRIPLPEDDKLNEIAEHFEKYVNNNCNPTVDCIKLVDSSEFTPNDRWDIKRFWSDDELVEMGEREVAVEHFSYIEDVSNQIEELQNEFKQVNDELEKLTSFKGKSVSIGDENYFYVRRGKRVTTKNCFENKGDIPVYSGSKDPKRPLGCISEQWLLNNSVPIENEPIVTVNANGNVGKVFVRKERCVIHDDVMVIDVVAGNIDLGYLKYQLESAIAKGDYEYEAKLYNRVKELSIEIPMLSNGIFDLELQKTIANALNRFDTVHQKLIELGDWSKKVRLKSENILK